MGLKLSKVKVQVVIASSIEWAFYFKMGRALLAVWKSSAQEIQPFSECPHGSPAPVHLHVLRDCFSL